MYVQLSASLSRETIVEALRELSNEDDPFLALDPRGEGFRFIAAGRRGGGSGVGAYEYAVDAM